MQIFDTHCHYNLPPINKAWQTAWDQAQKKGLVASLVAGASLENSRLAVKIAQSEDNLFASVGIHPEDASKDGVEKEIREIEKLAKEKKVLAIGEIGLDYFYEPHDKEAQKKLFLAQLQIANDLKLPIIFHVRDRGEAAYHEIIELIKKYCHNENSQIFHCISGPNTYINEILKMPNSYIGFDGNLTFKNAPNLREIFKIVQKNNPDKILLETDAPFLAPVPYRGQSCQPWMIVETAKFAKEELDCNLKQILENSYRAFNLPHDHL